MATDDSGTEQKSVTLSKAFIEKAESIAASQHRSLSNLLSFAIYTFFDWKPELDEKQKPKS